MKAVLQKTHSQGLICLDASAYEKLPQQFTYEINESKRTLTQNAALHLWFSQISDVLNAHGITQKAVLEKMKKGDLPNTPESVKAYYKAAMMAAQGKSSTTKQSTVDPNEMVDVMCHAFSVWFGITLPPFPSRLNIPVSAYDE